MTHAGPLLSSVKSVQAVDGIAGLILAAGESSRMGRDKALLTYHGRTFLEGVLATLGEAGLRRVVVVLGHHADDIRKTCKFSGAEVVVNRDYQRGQTSSLQAGLRLLARPEAESPEVEGVVLCLVDHPVASPETVRALVAAFGDSNPSIVTPTYQNRRGHPVLLSRTLFIEILALDPDEGANTVIHRYRDTTREVAVDDPGILIDVDDPEAYRRLEPQA